ncbi:Uncharacterized protein FKW44_000818, partial [Caligus rogercresseyi]
MLSGLCSIESTICRWLAEFKRGRVSTNGDKRSGRPKEVVTPEKKNNQQNT